MFNDAAVQRFIHGFSGNTLSTSDAILWGIFIVVMCVMGAAAYFSKEK